MEPLSPNVVFKNASFFKNLLEKADPDRLGTVYKALKRFASEGETQLLSAIEERIKCLPIPIKTRTGLQVKDAHSIFRLLALLIFGSEEQHHVMRFVLGIQLSTFRKYYLKTMFDDQMTDFHDYYKRIWRGDECDVRSLQLCADLFQITIRGINVLDVAVYEFLPRSFRELSSLKKFKSSPRRIVWIVYNSFEIFPVTPSLEVNADHLAVLIEELQKDAYEGALIVRYCCILFNEADCDDVSDVSDDCDARLISRLKEMDFERYLIAGEGNCLFRALSDRIFGDEELHEFMRMLVIAWFKAKSAHYLVDWQPTRLVGGSKETWEEYLERISRVGEYADTFCIQAVSDMFCLKIIVVYSGDVMVQDFYPYDSEAYGGPIFMCSIPKHMDVMRRRQASGSCNA